MKPSYPLVILLALLPASLFGQNKQYIFFKNPITGLLDSVSNTKSNTINTSILAGHYELVAETGKNGSKVISSVWDEQITLSAAGKYKRKGLFFNTIGSINTRSANWAIKNGTLSLGNRQLTITHQDGVVKEYTEKDVKLGILGLDQNYMVVKVISDEPLIEGHTKVYARTPESKIFSGHHGKDQKWILYKSSMAKNGQVLEYKNDHFHIKSVREVPAFNIESGKLYLRDSKTNSKSFVADLQFTNNELPADFIKMLDNGKKGQMYYIENMVIRYGTAQTNKSYACFVILK